MAKKDFLPGSKLGKEQEDILNNRNDSSFIVKGCAGSGKSLIALHKAKQIAALGESYTIVVYTKSLRKYFEDGLRKLGLKNVYHYHQWRHNQRRVKYLIVDECQDFSPFQIMLLKNTNPGATFSLVGDLYQGVRADEGIRSWDEWKEPVFENRAELKQLTVSYRNTVEIMSLAQAVAARYPIAGVGETRPVLRHGETPGILRAGNEKERLRLIRDQVQAWLDGGYHSIALMEKTEEQARKLFRQIDPGLNARLLSETDADYRGGVMILPAGIAKGMEFDCVGICDASAENFPDDEFLCRVLYVMMTRPLHRLCIWYRGEPSPLLPDGQV